MNNIDICKGNIANEIFSKYATPVLKKESEEVLESELIESKNIGKTTTQEVYYNDFKKLYDELCFQTASSNLSEKQKNVILEKGRDDIIKMVVGKEKGCKKWLRKLQKFLDSRLVYHSTLLAISATAFFFLIKRLQALSVSIPISLFAGSLIVTLVVLSFFSFVEVVHSNLAGTKVKIDFLKKRKEKECSCQKCLLKEKVIPGYSRKI